jgi:hypothetical protein
MFYWIDCQNVVGSMNWKFEGLIERRALLSAAWLRLPKREVHCPLPHKKRHSSQRVFFSRGLVNI